MNNSPEYIASNLTDMQRQWLLGYDTERSVVRSLLKIGLIAAADRKYWIVTPMGEKVRKIIIGG